MQAVRVQTSQNVGIDYIIAGIGDRVLAALIDYLILVGYITGVALLMNLISFFGAGGAGSIALTIIVYLPVLLYDLLCEVFMNGQSFGKKALKIRVVKLDGSQAGIGDYILRWLLRIIDITLLFGSVAILTILINGKGQRVGDIAAGTTVVKMKPPVTLKDTILTAVQDNYVPVFPGVTELTDNDIATIKEVLNANVENSKLANHLAYKTKTAIEGKIGTKSDFAPVTFLETVIRDFNYYTSKSQN
ncbi:RDD family protein [bacterium]|nr:RDD family protein [bacterium]